MKKEKKPKRKASRAERIILNILLFVCIVVFVFCLYKLGVIIYGYYQNRQVQSQVQTLFYGDSTLKQASGGEEASFGESAAFEDYTLSLEKLRETNPDVVGWIQVPDTLIDYPVLQTTDNDYYLTKNFYREYNSAGSIFMDYRNDLSAGRDNLVLYGHRMKDTSMFGNITKFLKEDFFREHPRFTFITDGHVYTCEIFAVYQTTTDFEYNRVGFDSDTDYLNFIEECRRHSKYATDVTVGPEDTIITLSTCDYALDKEKGRLVMQAKLVED
ncbi:MAG: class B sortase [Clostridia bacterium]|jgi:sortase, srtB family|uniref:Class B sortase n=1 Tax=Bianquea renquensis TaxID=2763661 RepID=A0A926HXZ7_9FIRM|nr:class B sortase [Bianquea renquensis]MBC8544307.1 class B sortase [Bianquea renquensis]